MIVGAYNSSAGAVFDGDIAEVVIHNGVVTTGDRDRIESYLAIKYGMTLS